MKYLYLILSVCFSLSLSAQSFLLNDGNEDLVEFDRFGCSTTIVENIGRYTDIASHPDGNIYAVTSGGQIFRFNAGSGTVSDIGDFPPLSGDIYTALTAAANGELFAASKNDGRLVSYVPGTGNITDYGTMGFGAEGDLTFYQGEMYMASTSNQLVKINPNNPSQNSVFLTFDNTVEIWGIVSYVDACNTETYAFSNDFPARVYQIDWQNATYDFVCTVNKEVFGGASEFEFDASESAIILNDILVTQTNCQPAEFDVLVDATGQNGVLDYSLDGIGFQEETLFEDLSAGTYTLYIEDALGCELMETFEIADGQVISIDTIFLNPVSCDGSEQGSISIEASSPNGDLVFSFEGGIPSTNNTFTGLDVGTYNIVITDPQGCTENLDVEVGQQEPALIIGSADGTPQWGAEGTYCGEDNGIIRLTRIDVIPGYQGDMEWSIDRIDWRVWTGPDSIFNQSAGDFVIYVRDDFGCVTELPVRLQESSGINVFEARGYDSGCAGNDGRIEVDAYAIDEIEYTLGGETNTTGIFENLTAGKYQIRLRIPGCSLDPIDVEIMEDCRIYIPNAFSPNQDGFNDTFQVYGSSDFEVTEILVFDRWGGIVYKGNDISTTPYSGNGWDGTINGTPAPSGIYTYLITALNPNGARQFSGDVTLMR